MPSATKPPVFVCIDRQELDLTGTRLLSWSLVDDALVLDLWGGSGHWRGYAGGAWLRSARVVQPPALALRASADSLDLDLCSRLDRLVASSRPLVVHVVARGRRVLHDVRSFDLTCGVDTISFTAPTATGRGPTSPASTLRPTP